MVRGYYVVFLRVVRRCPVSRVPTTTNARQTAATLRRRCVGLRLDLCVSHFCDDSKEERCVSSEYNAAICFL